MAKGLHASSVESLQPDESHTTHPLSLERLEIYHSDTFANKLVKIDVLHGSECK